MLAAMGAGDAHEEADGRIDADLLLDDAHRLAPIALGTPH